jgi:hypothetical protein
MATLDQIGEDVAATVAAIAGMVSCAYPPPDAAPYQGPAAWVDLGPIGVAMGNLELQEIQVTVTVATPRKGDYANEYRLVLDYARRVLTAFRQNIAVADDAMLMAPATIGRPIAARYGEADPNIVACTVTFAVQTEEETVNLLAL